MDMASSFHLPRSNSTRETLENTSSESSDNETAGKHTYLHLHNHRERKHTQASLFDQTHRLHLHVLKISLLSTCVKCFVLVVICLTV